ncbi:hypothetical protein IG631_17143 [Alternaria alternata]|nr:hypothetical protein IG631_17143 [Alternaria alternata]
MSCHHYPPCLSCIAPLRLRDEIGQERQSAASGRLTRGCTIHYIVVPQDVLVVLYGRFPGVCACDHPYDHACDPLLQGAEVHRIWRSPKVGLVGSGMPAID